MLSLDIAGPVREPEDQGIGEGSRGRRNIDGVSGLGKAAIESVIAIFYAGVLSSFAARVKSAPW